MLALLPVLIAASAPVTARAVPPPMPAQAAPLSAGVLTLHEGDAVVIRIGDAPASTAMTTLRVGDAARAVRLGSGEIRFRLERGTTGDTLLTAENNNAFYVSYQAVLTGEGGTAMPTSVCTLLPGGQPSYEHWSRQVVALTLYGFHAADEQAAACG